jgi:hypothetical protein
MFDGIGYLLRLPGFLFGSICNAIFSVLSLIVGNLFQVLVYIFAILSTPFIFVITAYSNDKAGWEKHCRALAGLRPFESAFGDRQTALTRWLEGNGKYASGASEADNGCVTWLVGIPLGLLILGLLIGN